MNADGLQLIDQVRSDGEVGGHNAVHALRVRTHLWLRGRVSTSVPTHQRTIGTSMATAVASLASTYASTCPYVRRRNSLATPNHLHPLQSREPIRTHESHADAKTYERLRKRQRGRGGLWLLAQNYHVVVCRYRVRQTTHGPNDFSLTLTHRVYRLVAAVDRSHWIADENVGAWDSRHRPIPTAYQSEWCESRL